MNFARRLLIQAALAGSILCLAGCPSIDHKSVAAYLNQRIAVPYVESREVRLFVATNRKGSGGCKKTSFSVLHSEKTVYGTCDINVPRNHAVGALDSDTSPARNTHFFVGAHQNLEKETFFKKIQAFRGKEVMLFVHGFNVPFQEALFRAVQIAYDVKFQGAVVLFTWPAGARSGLFSSLRMDTTYRENQKNAANTVQPMAEFIKELAGQGKRVHIMVHSMGHQVVLPALLRLANQGSGRVAGELILNAPDFPVREFVRIAPTLRKAARRVTLYCSPGDNALVASRRLNGNSRIGQCARVAGVDVINVNQVDSPILGVGGLGHGYYSGRAILGDIYQILLGLKVEKRLFVRRSGSPREDYVLRK